MMGSYGWILLAAGALGAFGTPLRAMQQAPAGIPLDPPTSPNWAYLQAGLDQYAAQHGGATWPSSSHPVVAGDIPNPSTQGLTLADGMVVIDFEALGQFLPEGDVHPPVLADLVAAILEHEMWHTNGFGIDQQLILDQSGFVVEIIVDNDAVCFHTKVIHPAGINKMCDAACEAEGQLHHDGDCYVFDAMRSSYQEWTAPIDPECVAAIEPCPCCD